MAEGDDAGEDRFFKAKPREESYVGHVGPPPPLWPKIVIGGVIAFGVMGVAFWHCASPPEGTLWVHHPGPGVATVAIDGIDHELKPGKLADVQVRLGGLVEIKSGDRRISLDPHDSKGEVSIVDLGG